MANIVHEVRIRAGQDEVYEAIATEAGVRGWWSERTELEEYVGGLGAFQFMAPEDNHVHRVRVDELTRPSRVRWTVLASPHEEWKGTTIQFDLRSEGEETVLEFAHRGFPGTEGCFDRCDNAWGYFMQSIKLYVETGVGTPQKTPVLVG